MKEQSAAVNQVEICILNEDESTPRSNQELELPPKIPKDAEKNEGPEPISNKNELHFMYNKDQSSTPRTDQQHKIPKVPEMLGNLYKKDKDCFDPRVVSIGPYHHGEAHLHEVEELKTKLAWQYCETESGVADLYKIVKDVAKDARKVYDNEASQYDDLAFTKMMFLDGCFILEFMCLLVEEDYQTMGMKNNVIANVKRDLFLLENQLPYIVLKALMKAKVDEKDGNEWIEKQWKWRIKMFITICRRLPPAVKPWMFGASKYFYRPKDKSQSPLHLLDITRKRFVKLNSEADDENPYDQIPIRKRTRTRSKSDDWYSYYSARVLNSMGIWFRPNKTGSFSDVKFESQLFIRGVLTLPPILIDASTKSLLLNLLAFETTETLSRRHDDHSNNVADKMQDGVTSYMCFMDSLIDNAEDVMILRSHNVIVNCLGTDQEVADLFNDIASNLVPNPRTYAEAKRGIQSHCNNTLKKWMAEFLHTHFRSPWTLLALCGAIFVIALTVVQTYYAAKPPKR